MKTPSKLRKVLARTIHGLRSDRIGGLAAEIAFYGALSIFPAMIALGALLGSLDQLTGQAVAGSAQQAILRYVGDVLSSEKTGTVDATTEAFQAGENVVGFAVLAAIWASSRGFAAVIGALDVAYKVEETRSWIGTRITAIALSIGSIIVGAFALVMLVISPFFGVGESIAEWAGVGPAVGTMWRWVQPLVLFVVVMAWVTAIYYFAPNHHTPPHWDLPGAFLATAWWLAASLGFGFYIRFASQGTNAVYGLLGGGLTLLMLLWVIGLGLIVGAELNAALAHEHERVTHGSKLAMLSDEVRERFDRGREERDPDHPDDGSQPNGVDGEPPPGRGASAADHASPPPLEPVSTPAPAGDGGAPGRPTAAYRLRSRP